MGYILRIYLVGIAAWPTDAFVKANDFTGKTVVTFCTASSSGIGESGDVLEKMTGTGTWITGERFLILEIPNSTKFVIEPKK